MNNQTKAIMLTDNSAIFQKELQKLVASITLEDDAQLEEIDGKK